MSGPLAEGNDGFGGSGVSGIRGSNSVVESQPSKLLVAGSIPVSRSSLNVFSDRDTGRCSSAVERVLGKDEVTGSSPVIGSRSLFKLFLRVRTQSGPREAASL